MITTKLKGVAAAFVLVAITAIIIWQERRAKQLTAEATALREQVEQASSLRDENQRLAENLKAATEDSEANLRELMRLRGEVGTMRRTQQDNARLKAEHDRLLSQGRQAAFSDTNQQPYQYTPEQWGLFVEKLNFGKKLGLALITLADQNAGQVPSTLAPAASWLATNAVALDGDSTNGISADNFELIYKGHLPELKNPERIILAREKEPVELAEGRWIRMYVFADGHVERIQATAGDGFAAREKELWPGDSDP